MVQSISELLIFSCNLCHVVTFVLQDFLSTLQSKWAVEFPQRAFDLNIPSAEAIVRDSAVTHVLLSGGLER